MIRWLSIVCLLLLFPCLAMAQGQNLPFARTEKGGACASYVATRQPFFGELHLHTTWNVIVGNVIEG